MVVVGGVARSGRFVGMNTGEDGNRWVDMRGGIY